MGKFKVGDRVRLLRTDYPEHLPQGSVQVVSSTDSDGFSVDVCDVGELYFLDSEAELWRPAVGDRVRYTGKDSRYHEEDLIGLEGTVKTVDTIQADVAWDCGERHNGHWTLGAKYIGNLEPMAATPAAAQPAAEAWVPKVGDRVVVTYGHGWAGTGVVTLESSASCNVKMDGGEFAGQEGGFAMRYLQPFRIEAGRYYKTRDGRKVGPMKRNGDMEDFIVMLGDGQVWMADGKYTSGRSGDLIAEWPDTTVNTAATVDFQADEYGSGVRAAPAKFKVGDVVRATHADADITPGKTYVVIEVDEHDDDYPVRVTDNIGDGWWLRADRFELATTEPTASAIVALIEDGKPKPASRPFVHTTIDAANTEAARLAGIHKGSKFGVYVLTGEPVMVPKPVYKHAWQTEAANGNKIAAIKELRAIADVGLYAAKTAVEDWLSRHACAA